MDTRKYSKIISMVSLRYQTTYGWRLDKNSLHYSRKSAKKWNCLSWHAYSLRSNLTKELLWPERSGPTIRRSVNTNKKAAKFYHRQFQCPCTWSGTSHPKTHVLWMIYERITTGGEVKSALETPRGAYVTHERGKENGWRTTLSHTKMKRKES